MLMTYRYLGLRSWLRAQSFEPQSLPIQSRLMILTMMWLISTAIAIFKHMQRSFCFTINKVFRQYSQVSTMALKVCIKNICAARLTFWWANRLSPQKMREPLIRISWTLGVSHSINWWSLQVFLYRRQVCLRTYLIFLFCILWIHFKPVMEALSWPLASQVFRVHPPSKGRNILVACGPGNNGRIHHLLISIVCIYLVLFILFKLASWQYPRPE